MSDALDERSGTRVPLLPQAGGRKADVRREFSAPGDSNRLWGIFTAGLRAYGRLKDLTPLGRGVRRPPRQLDIGGYRPIVI
jgi:hypothetical protein